MTTDPPTLAFIGGGHITEIIVDNLLQHRQAAPERVVVSDPDPERLQTMAGRYRVRTLSDNALAAKAGDVVVICVLPQVVPAVIADLNTVDLSGDKLLITLAAGIGMDAYDALEAKVPIVRALPNPPSRIGRGVVALAFNKRVSARQRREVEALFESMGRCFVMPEPLIDVVTALSSPAPVYLLLQALIDAGVRAGIDRATSTAIVGQTIAGAMAVYEQGELPPQALLNEAATPGGISTECLFTLERYALRAALSEAIDTGAQKARSMHAALTSED